MIDLTEKLRSTFADRLRENEPMAKHTNFRIGGPARWFVDVRSEEELTAALAAAKEANVPVFVMGGGSNTLFADQGFPGLVIQIAMRGTKIQGNRVTAEAGVLMVGLARQTGDAGLEGLEWAISLPGTVGGAVRGNAGCFGGETKDRLVSSRVLRDGEIVEMTNKELKFGYRDSILKHEIASSRSAPRNDNGSIVLSATFELTPADASVLTVRMAEILAKRKASQPMNVGSAGCLFKNVELLTDEDVQRAKKFSDIPGVQEMIAGRRLSAGWLIDHSGLKGMRVGDAQVSESHGNFIVNLGRATASDVRDLAIEVKRAVQERFGIELHEEVQLVGFDS
jgi:UDP-N-acetylmuramate dehydrogenase